MKIGLARAVTVLVALLFASHPITARDSLMASPYGSVVADLLRAFHATEDPCLGPVDVSDVCFTVHPATVGGLAEILENVVAGYRSAGLSGGEWRAANGVWAVELLFGDGGYGRLEVYLTELQRAEVRGKVVLRAP